MKIRHKKQGYDALHQLMVDGKKHYIYEEEGSIRGYGMGAQADEMRFFEISKEAYEKEVLPEDARPLITLSIEESLSWEKFVSCILQGQHFIRFKGIHCRIEAYHTETKVYTLVPVAVSDETLARNHAFIRDVSWKAYVQELECPTCHCKRYVSVQAQPEERLCPKCNFEAFYHAAKRKPL